MKKLLVTLVLVAATAAWAQEAAQPAGQPAQAAPQQKKEIKDPTEYNAYITALNQQQPAAKAQALEAFLQQYPNSVMKPDALDLLMRTYQQAGDQAKVVDTANRLLQIEPNSVPALALLTFIKRGQIEQGQGNPQSIAELQQLAQRGVQALPNYQKPEGMNDQQFTQTKAQLGGLFNAAAGFAALQQKDYKGAAGFLQEAVTVDPSLTNVYPLAVAYLSAQPADVRGLWYIARAVALAKGTPSEAGIAKFGLNRYIKYHGGDDGWTDLLAQAQSTPNPPTGWQVAPAPTPAELAAKLVQEKPVAKMSFDEIQLVLTSGNQQAADTVWNGLKDKTTAFLGKVVDASPTKLSVATTADDIDANKADVDLTMAANIPARLMPKVGAEIKLEGVPTTYEPNPFMIHMEKGAFVSTGEPKTPPRHTTPKKPQ